MFKKIYKYLLAVSIIFIVLVSSSFCLEDHYLEKYSYTYNNSPDNEIYVKIEADSEGVPIGKLEFDHGYGFSHSSQWNPALSYYMDKYEYPNQEGVLPMVNLSWYDAKVLCESQFVDLNGNGIQDENENSKRLCSSSEWKETCRGSGKNGPGEKDGMWAFEETDGVGTKDFHFPYGGDGTAEFYKEGYCNDDSAGAAFSGEFKRCANSKVSSAHPATSKQDAVFDLTGNVWEWVDFDFYGALPSVPGALDCGQFDGTNPDVCKDEYVGQKQILGGYYLSVQFANCNRSFILPAETEDLKIGFRCCRQ